MPKKKSTHGGKRKGAGRKAKEKTITTSFRVHKESLIACRKKEVPLNQEVNKLVKRLARKD